MWGPLVASLYACSVYASPPIDRRALVARYNPTRNASSSTTPMQIGNGNFAFGADITGLQTLQPWAIMSTWGWKNDSLPAGKTIQDVYDYTGISLDNHGRLVQYMFNGAAPMQQWMISNPNRVNLGAVGLVFWSQDGSAILNITESDLTAVKQELDLWSGTLTSNFVFEGTAVQVKTTSAQTVDSIGVTVSSALLNSGRLGVFVDFPWNDGLLKFSDPFVGSWNNASIHTTTLDATPRGTIGAEIAHTLVNSTFITSIGGDLFTIARDSPAAHRYTIRPSANSSTFSFSTTWGLTPPASVLSPSAISLSSSRTWEDYWTKTGFVDVFTGSTDPRADELQRRIILSRYLMRVNEAGDYPPQESGLVNNGWYGKFHLEMYFWHSQHWALWNNWDLLLRSSSVYDRFLETSIARAQVQEGWPTGARWGKMSDPSGRSAPGQINELLIWQQPHPLVFANYEYRAFPTTATLRKWESVVRHTADWMATFAWFNETTGVYDLGPPMYQVAEDNVYTNTLNPAFELSYWRLGLGFAESWLEKLGEPVPSNWTTVKNGLAKLPVDNGTYKVYEDVNEDFWTDRTYINDHPALAGLNGWLPPTEGLDLETSRLTTEKVWTSWNVSNLWGWDFPLLAMSAARIGEQEQAVEFLLHPLFRFDDVGMPIGGVRVPTPYFPGSGALLYAVALMAHGWDGSNGTAPGFPAEGWNVRAEGLSKAM
ncbi:Six-hairpin glycosidase-like protein [Mycena albidolilacea]|uniref:Six-hairpin glycosidase-like protein n=1 Tax=Mycena albidolilacea TaxID=1033008 RepID=A0AAD6ZA59_9AGAR|nr:Six-hairpin glycosidase-like protein [Mycena albidolilacea]